jgi:regulator of PEP synthase PpsR (kinase-PPPase family)
MDRFGWEGMPRASAGGPEGAAASPAREFHLHLISDATGETINAIARACVAQFEGVEALEHFWNMVRSERQLAMVIEGVKEFGGVVIFSLVNPLLRRQLEEACATLGVPCVPVLDAVIGALAKHLGMESQARPGRQHELDEEYFNRIDAMAFAMAHDDGQNVEGLAKADVILIGVSRTSKTPTSIYLANRGIRAANIPLVPGVALPEQISGFTRPLVVGLTTDPERLLAVRRQRLKQINAGEDTDYTDPELVREEVQAARRLFAQNRWPVINVARRSIEETAAEIINLLSRHWEALPHGVPPQEGGEPAGEA